MFDVFLAHNSIDKPQVRRIASKLRQRGLNPWLDEEQIAPGELFQDAIQKAIPQIKSAAICIGSQGLGKWQVMELHTLTNQFINKGIKVIPLLLPGVDSIPGNLLFLQQLNWVSFESIDDANAFYRLEWGITGVKPGQSSQLASSSPSYSSPQPKSDGVELKSERGVDYTKLRDLLAAGKWKEADQETSVVMCQAAGREKYAMRVEDIDNFPCEDLRTIDQLWVKYSNGRFGFSVQKKIYQSLGGTREYNKKVWYAFGERVGWTRGGNWLNYSDLTFNLNAPEGHLPAYADWTWREISSAVISMLGLGGGGRLSVGCILLSRRDL